MSGGIAILLLVIVVLVAGAIALALYGTSDLLWNRETNRAADRERTIPGGQPDGSR